MRMVFIMMFLANVAVTLAGVVLLPGRVAVHFGAGGMADGWGSSIGNAVLMAVIQLVLFSSIYFSPRYVFRVPARLVNLPNKEYWLSPENRACLEAKLREFMWSFGSVLFLFLMVVGVLSLKANLDRTLCLDLRLFFVTLGAFLVYTVGWIVLFMRAFRMPIRKPGGEETDRPRTHTDSPARPAQAKH